MRQQYFSDGEWATLVQTPKQAIIAVALADKTDPVSFLKETQAAVQILAAELQRGDISSDLGKSVIASLNELAAQETLQGEELLLKKQFELLETIQTFNSASEGQKQAIAHLSQVGSILASKVTAVQAKEFKQWIVDLATEVAKSVKEGRSIFGVGGERVSREESGILSSIEAALEVKL
ncbi:hypothetical protein K9N68_38160 (plasmid) [Kovacikia minuta CCNUW1]|uniref:hypothetical protein n=1 Tax=Kovacikia minuta TaxID=2931930 RepID=UPI001CCF2A02|nr:hypothetical protein [Kovacikia minuta]UBF30026.1 hypothetical protein K9N68_38160 [Kovacikia minuta CCNUW1]